MRHAEDLDLRPVTDDELQRWLDAVELAFGEEPSEAQRRRVPRLIALERTLGAFDGERIVGTGGAFTFTMSLPFAEPAPCAGVTVIGVAHDWRRRGLLARMMRRLLEDARDRDEPFAALYASESPIYGRYGFGMSGRLAHYTIEHPWTALLDPANVGAVRLVDATDAIARFPTVLDRVRGQRGGHMSRTPVWWDAWLGTDDRHERAGFSPRFHALLDDRGYVVYRIKQDWGDHGAEGRLKVEEMMAADPEAHAALWAFVFGADLVKTFEAPGRPPDDPLPLALAYRGRLRERVTEGVWLRLVDVGAALGARGYLADDRLRFEVHDPFTGWNTGRWELEVVDGDPYCGRGEGDPDLRLDVRDLASLALGGVSASELAWARRVEEVTPGAAQRADRLFAVPLAPWNAFVF